MRVFILFTLLSVMSMLPSALSKQMCHRAVSIIMVLDESGSIGKSNFWKEKKFVSSMIPRFTANRYGILFGVVGFSHRVRVPIRLRHYTNARSLRRKISGIRYFGGGTFTGRAFGRVLNLLRRVSNRISNVVVLISDGASSDHARAVKRANQLKRNGAEIICVAVGRDNKVNSDLINQLKQLASKPQWVFVSRFDAMKNIENRLVKGICDASEPCHKKPCLNNGKCSVVGYKFKCTCSKGYTGTRCETRVNPCYKIPCLNHGLCSVVGDTFKCTCPTGYSGTRCQTRINPCNKKPCLNHGKCSVVGYTFKCTCSKGYTGTRCQTRITCTDQNKNCQYWANRGECVKNPRYMLARCCKSCKTRTCTDQNKNCQYWANRGECVKNPRYMLARCCKSCKTRKQTCKRVMDVVVVLDGSGSVGKDNFVKEKDFISGLVSKFKINENGAHLGVITFANEPSMPIPLNFYTTTASLQRALQYVYYVGGGKYAGKALGAVRSKVFNTCANRKYVAKVVVLVTNGKPRDHKLAVQNAKLLKRSGVVVICVAIGDAKLVKDLQKLASKPKWVFKTNFNALKTVENDLTKAMCVAADPCNIKPCLNHGKCKLVGDTFNCSCPKGYSGKTCEHDPCNTKPCLNHGKCKLVGDTFNCTCPKGYGGKSCENDPCKSKPCLNDGKCSVEGDTFQCTCPSEYDGIRCEARVNIAGLSQSAIVGHNQGYIKQLGKWLPPGHSSWKICWRKSVDGLAENVFHTKCDFKGPSLAIIKSGEYVFGGYNSLDWHSWLGQAFQSAPGSFMFSLRNKDNLPPFKANIYRLPQYAIHTQVAGPALGNDLHIGRYTSTASLGYTYEAPHGYRYDTEKVRVLLAGKKVFVPDEVEVFNKT